jgi:rod shape-determining protein MreC
VGHLAEDPSGRLRVRLSADYERLEFLRVLRNQGTTIIKDPGALIAPDNAIVSGTAEPSSTDTTSQEGEVVE